MLDKKESLEKAYFRLGVIAVEDKLFDNALQCFEKAYLIDDDFMKPELTWRMAELLYKVGNPA